MVVSLIPLSTITIVLWSYELGLSVKLFLTAGFLLHNRETALLVEVSLIPLRVLVAHSLLMVWFMSVSSSHLFDV